MLRVPRTGARAWRYGATVGLMLCAASAPAHAGLPDGRNYELVSPASKNGGDVMAVTMRTRAAAAGDAVSFASLGGFGDIRGASIGTEFVSKRTGLGGTSGWSTHGITPEQPPMTLQGAFFGRDPVYEGEFSSDLSRAVYRAWRPITSITNTNVRDIANLYLRTDVLKPGPGAFQLITDAFAPLAPSLTKPSMAGASADLSHVIFESPLNLASDARGGGQKLYEWAGGVVRLAGILPDETPAATSRAGLGATQNFYTPGMISRDGMKVFFQAPANASGNAYMRIDGSATVLLNESEKTVRDSPSGAAMWATSADGMRAFFITGEGLIDGDDDSTDLYMYDVAASPGHHLTQISRDSELDDTHSAASVVGTSADGRYVYFVASGQLVSGEPLLDSGRGLYMWHDGVLRYIGEFRIPNDPGFNGPGTSWSFWQTTSTARVTLDGRHLLFMTRSDAGFRGRGGFAGYDHGSTCTFDTSLGGPCREFYVYSAETGRLRCASCNPSGAAATAEALIAAVAGGSAAGNSSHGSHALSDDGRRVFFHTKEALVLEDVNGKYDAYEYDIATESVHLLSSGKNPYDSYFLDASANGDDAFFVTRERLVGWDGDDSYDLYDARVNGGLPDPVAPSPACSGDACQAASGSAPAPRTASSLVFSGLGDAVERLKPHLNAKDTKRCRHRRVRVVIRGRARCVRKGSVRAGKRVSNGARGGAK